MTDYTVPLNTTRTTRLDMEGTDTLTVDGTFNVSANNQTVRFLAPTNGAVIDVNGGGILQNTAASGRAIRFETGIGSTLNASITNDGSISAGNDAIQIDASTVAFGQVTITNGGTLTSSTGQAIDFANAGGTFIANITNTLSITADVSEAIRIGGRATITNVGNIQGGTAAGYSVSVDGIQFQDNATGSVENQQFGVITGDRHGIDAGTGSTISVANGSALIGLAIIEGRNGSGVGSDGSATVVNYGTITGAFSDSAGSDTNGSTPGQPDGGGPDGINDGDGDGIDIDGQATIDNYGTIQGTGAGGTGSDGRVNTSEGIAAGGGTFTNYAGGVIRGTGLGILIDDSSQGNAPFLTTIVNDGTIRGFNGIGIRIISNLDDTITNSGALIGIGKAIEFGSGANTLFLKTGSTITGIVDGGAGTDTLNYADVGAGISVNLGVNAADGFAVLDFENVVGTAFSDQLIGDIDANALTGGGGDDTLDGGAGTNDRALFSGAFAGYTITETAGGFTVKDLRGAGFDGTDTLAGIEGLVFAGGVTPIFDAGDAFEWSALLDTLAGGLLDTRSLAFDDGRTTTADDDQTNASDVSVYQVFRDAGGATTLELAVYDDGRAGVLQYDVGNAQTWSRAYTVYDVQGRFDHQQLVNDDGTTTLFDLDQDGTKPWQHITTAFDVNGVFDRQLTLNDDGTTSFLDL